MTKSSEKLSFQVVVIGGGPAGVIAALRARELGASVALVERSTLGGVCTNDGCVPTRVLARAARLQREAEQFSSYGLEAQHPTLDFSRLMARAQQVVYQIHEKKQLLNHLKVSGVQVFDSAGSARFIDSHALELGNGQRLFAEKFVLCAGGRARRLSFPGAELTLTHSDIWRIRHQPKSLVIVGAAATGCQLATIFNAFGTQVTLLEAAPRILPMEDPYLSEALYQAFNQRGIQIQTDIEGIERIEKVGSNLQVSYRLAGKEHLLQAEAVILAVGWVGNIEDLNLSAAGVETERSYVKVNDFLQTSAAHIFAAGDITGRMMLVQSASSDGRIAVENALLGTRTTCRRAIVPHGGFTDPEYGSVGLTEQQAAEELGPAGYLAINISYDEIDRAVIDGLTTGFCRLIVSTQTRYLIGAHVVGEQALEIVQIVAAGMAADMRVEQLAELQIAYPTYSAIVGLAARRIVKILGLQPVTPDWRGLDRRHLAEWERMDR